MQSVRLKRIQVLTLSIIFTLFSYTAWAEIKVGLVLEKSGKDDKSFNASAYEGLKRAEKTLGVYTKTIESPDNSAPCKEHSPIKNTTSSSR
jgi:basic membrane protein A